MHGCLLEHFQKVRDRGILSRTFCVKIQSPFIPENGIYFAPGVVMNRERGFSLIELLIVVAVLTIIAAVTVPNLLKARSAANESSAISSVRAIITAQSTFTATLGNGSYAANLAILSTAGLIDQALGSGSKDGYNFTSIGAGAIFTVTATPMTFDVTGNRGFFADQTGVIRFDISGTATSSSAPLGGESGG